MTLKIYFSFLSPTQLLSVFCCLPHPEVFLPLSFVPLPPSLHSNTTEGSLPLNYSGDLLKLTHSLGHSSLGQSISPSQPFWIQQGIFSVCVTSHPTSLSPISLQDSSTVKLLADRTAHLCCEGPI